MLTIRNLILCVAVPVALVYTLQHHPQYLHQALALLPGGPRLA